MFEKDRNRVTDATTRHPLEVSITRLDPSNSQLFEELAALAHKFQLHPEDSRVRFSGLTVAAWTREGAFPGFKFAPDCITLRSANTGAVEAFGIVIPPDKTSILGAERAHYCRYYPKAALAHMIIVTPGAPEGSYALLSRHLNEVARGQGAEHLCGFVAYSNVRGIYAHGLKGGFVFDGYFVRSEQRHLKLDPERSAYIIQSGFPFETLLVQHKFPFLCMVRGVTEAAREKLPPTHTKEELDRIARFTLLHRARFAHHESERAGRNALRAEMNYAEICRRAFVNYCQRVIAFWETPADNRSNEIAKNLALPGFEQEFLAVVEAKNDLSQAEKLARYIPTLRQAQTDLMLVNSLSHPFFTESPHHSHRPMQNAGIHPSARSNFVFAGNIGQSKVLSTGTLPLGRNIVAMTKDFDLEKLLRQHGYPDLDTMLKS